MIKGNRFPNGAGPWYEHYLQTEQLKKVYPMKFTLAQKLSMRTDLSLREAFDLPIEELKQRLHNEPEK